MACTAVMDGLIRPMLATPGPLPVGRAGFEFEIKWDGARLVVYVRGSRVRGFSRNDRDVSPSYPEIQELGAAVGGRSCVLDGELVAFNPAGVVHFGTLQHRMQVTAPAIVRELMGRIPVVYVVFDLLALDGKPWTARPYVERRQALLDLELVAPHVQVPPSIGIDGPAALAVSERMGAEGVIAKRQTSLYFPGRRSPDWIKTKHHRMQEVVIGGWRPGQGRRAGTIGSLLMGIPTPQGLAYAGRVGTGFTATTLTQLAALLKPLERRTSPFTNPPAPREITHDAHWVTPKLVGEVNYTEWTTDGTLRHPSWRGLRPDKNPNDVVKESH